MRPLPHHRLLRRRPDLDLDPRLRLNPPHRLHRLHRSFAPHAAFAFTATWLAAGLHPSGGVLGLHLHLIPRPLPSHHRLPRRGLLRFSQ